MDNIYSTHFVKMFWIFLNHSSYIQGDSENLHMSHPFSNVNVCLLCLRLLPMSFKTSKIEVSRTGPRRRHKRRRRPLLQWLLGGDVSLWFAYDAWNKIQTYSPNGGSNWWFGRVRKKKHQLNKHKKKQQRHLGLSMSINWWVKQEEGIPFPEPTVCPSRIGRTQHLFLGGKLFVSGSVYQECNKKLKLYQTVRHATTQLQEDTHENKVPNLQQNPLE